MRLPAQTPSVTTVLILVAACTLQQPAISPRPDEAPRQPLRLRVTQYYTTLEADYPPGDTVAFGGAGGIVLHRGSQEFLDAATKEGSARLANGTVLNWGRKVGDTIEWKTVAGPYGEAANGCPLVPWRSAAVDPDVVPLGSSIRIAETVGMTLPDGASHDGTWWANDIGTSISADRIDLFTGAGIASMDAVYAHGITHLQPLTVTVIETNAGCAPPP